MAAPAPVPVFVYVDCKACQTHTFRGKGFTVDITTGGRTSKLPFPEPYTGTVFLGRGVKILNTVTGQSRQVAASGNCNDFEISFAGGKLDIQERKHRCLTPKLLGQITNCFKCREYQFLLTPEIPIKETREVWPDRITQLEWGGKNITVTTSPKIGLFLYSGFEPSDAYEKPRFERQGVFEVRLTQEGEFEIKKVREHNH